MLALLQYDRKVTVARNGLRENNCAIRLPSEDDKWLEFENYSNKERVPFIIYRLGVRFTENKTVEDRCVVVHKSTARDM